MNRSLLAAAWLVVLVFPVCALASAYVAVRIVTNTDAALITVFGAWLAASLSVGVRAIINDLRGHHDV